MLFTTSIIWQNLEVYEDEIQEWIECMQRENESWSACDQPIREENGFDKKKAEETYVWLVGLLLQETLLILVTYHLRNGMKNKA